MLNIMLMCQNSAKNLTVLLELFTSIKKLIKNYDECSTRVYRSINIFNQKLPIMLA